jgi:phosphoribosylaminoimidazole carboxylase (NCAIR synthetase)
MKKVGILGGGQLGRMLLQEAANYPVETYVLENDPGCPSAHLCHHFIKGDIKSFDDVYAFGKNLDAITIEIEAVNVDALEKLEAEGVKVFPKPAALRIIKNKIIQKEFYKQHSIPSPLLLLFKTNRNYLQSSEIGCLLFRNSAKEVMMAGEFRLYKRQPIWIRVLMLPVCSKKKLTSTKKSPLSLR